MCYMSGSFQMENVYATENEAGVWQWLFGKTITSIVLYNTGTTDGFVGIAAPSLARILPGRIEDRGDQRYVALRKLCERAFLKQAKFKTAAFSESYTEGKTGLHRIG